MPGMKEKKKVALRAPRKMAGRGAIIGGTENSAIFPGEIAVFYVAYRM
jgi:hypothetical protein